MDDTVAVARRLRPDIRIVHQTRRGKGNALACGFAAASGDVIVMIDADGSTDPAEIPRFVAALRGGADFAKGSRFLPAGGSADITAFRRAGNRTFSALVNLLFRTRYSDLCYGYNAFWAHCLPVFDLDSATPKPAPARRNGRSRNSRSRRLWGDGFEIETLLHLRAARANLNVVEVPSFEYLRGYGTSNLNPISDGIRVLRVIAREWPRRTTARRPMVGAVRHKQPS